MINKAKDTVKLYWKSFKLFFGIEGVDIYTHNIYKADKDLFSKKRVRNLKELLQHTISLKKGNLYINNKKVQYVDTMSVIDKEGDFYFVCLYK